MNESKLRAIWKKTDGHCHFCGDPVEFEKRGWNEDLSGYWEVDHVIQQNKGGEDSVDNYLPACTRCNRLRWHRTGGEIRELLLLGLIAQGEIKRNTQIGQKMVDLKEKRLTNNQKRRVSAR